MPMNVTVAIFPPIGVAGVPRESALVRGRARPGVRLRDAVVMDESPLVGRPCTGRRLRRDGVDVIPRVDAHGTSKSYIRLNTLHVRFRRITHVVYVIHGASKRFALTPAFPHNAPRR